MNRAPDAIVGTTSADVPTHGLGDLVVGWMGILRQQRRRRHDLSRLTVAALWNILGDPCLLQFVESIEREAFYGRDVLACNLRNRRRAGAHRSSIDVHRTGAA